MTNVNYSLIKKSVMAALAFSLLSPLGTAAQSNEKNTVVISNVFSGALITVWALGANNWLWGYTPYDARDWVDLYNWEVRYNADSTLTFINKHTEYCMVAYSSSGLTHNTCDANNNNQKFSLWPAASGAVQIKSVSQNKCIQIGDKSNYSFVVTFADCTAAGSVVDTRQLWVLGAERNASPAAMHDEL